MQRTGRTSSGSQICGITQPRERMQPGGAGWGRQAVDRGAQEEPVGVEGDDGGEPVF